MSIPADWPVYRIIRFRKSGSRSVLRTRVTLAEAQAHCKDPRTRREGVFFDGYDLMEGFRGYERPDQPAEPTDANQ